MKTGSASSAAIASDCQVTKKKSAEDVSRSAGGRSCKQLPVCFAYCEEGFALPTHKLLKKLDQNFHTVFVRTILSLPPRGRGTAIAVEGACVCSKLLSHFFF